MAIYNGTIQMRRGQYKDLIKGNIQAGEFAVCIDNDTHNKKVFLGFGDGVVKELGTFEEFESRFATVYKDLLDLAQKLDVQENDIIIVQNSILNDYYPQIKAFYDGSKDYYELIKNAVDLNIPQFYVDFNTGLLMYNGGMFNFFIDKLSGHLMWEVA